MTARHFAAHLDYVLAAQTHKLHEARKACKVYTRKYSAEATPEQLAAWRRQMAERDLARGHRNLATAVADLYYTEVATRRWANANLKALLDWTRAPEGLHRPNDN